MYLPETTVNTIQRRKDEENEEEKVDRMGAESGLTHVRSKTGPEFVNHCCK